MRTSTKGGCKSIVPARKDNIRKASAQMKLKIGRDVPADKRDSTGGSRTQVWRRYWSINKREENHLAMADTEMTKTWNSFCASELTAKVGSQAPHAPVQSIQSERQRGSGSGGQRCQRQWRSVGCIEVRGAQLDPVQGAERDDGLHCLPSPKKMAVG